MLFVLMKLVSLKHHTEKNAEIIKVLPSTKIIQKMESKIYGVYITVPTLVCIYTLHSLITVSIRSWFTMFCVPMALYRSTELSMVTRFNS